MITEPFATGTSRLHQADPRCKLVVAICFAVSAALLQTIPIALAGLGFSFSLVLAARLPFSALRKRVAVVNLFILFLWVFLPFTTNGETLYTLGPLSVTRQGLTLATLITIKSNAILLAFIALCATSTITETGKALTALKVPQKLVLLLLFTWRYVHVMAQEYQRLTTAAAMRGFVPETSLHTYRTYANLAGMVLVRTFDRAERVDQAMRLRGFDGTFRTLGEPPVSRRDIPFALAGAAFAIVLLLMDFTSLFNLASWQ